MEQALLRLNKAIDYLKDRGKIHKQQDIADTLGMGKARVSEALQGKPGKFTEGFLKRFALAYSDYINDEWLVIGEGEMLKPDKSMRPHYDAKASAGFMDGISEGKMSAEFRAMAIPLLNYDFSIDASGDSMMPRIEDGDTLLCRKSSDRLNPPLGKMCVIDTKDGAVVKVISSATDKTLTLHSLNPRYRNYKIDIETILGIAEIVGLIRNF